MDHERAPAYVHALLDALLNGTPIDFGGQPVPEDVRQRLEHHFDGGTE